ncbi:MAG: VWA domain-containing protein [Acidobacteriota bacterium]|nr:VWA domain-containing protein [Acidobacteriota bacterium]
MNPPMIARTRIASVLAASLLVPAAGTGVAVDESNADEPRPAAAAQEAATPRPLDTRFVRWLERVGPLISDEEREFFVSLPEDYRREAFIQAFWKARDPDPRTPLNELQVLWEDRVDAALSQWGTLEDARALFYLLNGPPGRFVLPDGRTAAYCLSRTSEMEIWFYGGSDRTARHFVVIFLATSRNRPYVFWHDSVVRRPVSRRGLPTTNIAVLCGDEWFGWAAQAVQRDLASSGVIEEVSGPPEAPEEWLATFAAFNTDLPVDATRFDVDIEWDFPGRNQTRTVTHGLVMVPGASAGRRSFQKREYHSFQMTGEVIRDDRLFETFRYRFELPASGEEGDAVPLVFTRYLRPGEVQIRLKIEDVFGQQFAIVNETIDVPNLEEAQSLRRTILETFPALAEANQAAARGERLLRLVPPRDERLRVGMVRFSTHAIGDFDAVAFSLDGREILRKRRPPFGVELNLGSHPTEHRIRVEGLKDGKVVASDEMSVNRGGQRFRARFIEPRSGEQYLQSTRAAVEIAVPDGEEIERLELFLGEERIATLYQPPWVQPVVLDGPNLTYLRAAAFLADGSSTEDVVFINSPNPVERIDVQYVELFASVVDERGRPIPELEQDRFRIAEDGVQQTVRRFEWVDDTPFHAGLLLDTSASMQDSIDQVRAAAQRFVDNTLRPRDRMAVLAFANRARVESRFTKDRGQLARALAGLRATGTTSLYDSLVFALSYFDGISGQKALLLLSDGKDENSSFTFESALETAQRSGVTIYAIGLREAAVDRTTRRVLERIAEETGGQAFFIDGVSQLDAIYTRIERELRNRYLLTYQSTSNRPESEFRVVRVEVDARDAEVRTMSGYYP